MCAKLLSAAGPTEASSGVCASLRRGLEAPAGRRAGRCGSCDSAAQAARNAQSTSARIPPPTRAIGSSWNGRGSYLRGERCGLTHAECARAPIRRSQLMLFLILHLVRTGRGKRCASCPHSARIKSCGPGATCTPAMQVGTRVNKHRTITADFISRSLRGRRRELARATTPVNGR